MKGGGRGGGSEENILSHSTQAEKVGDRGGVGKRTEGI